MKFYVLGFREGAAPIYYGGRCNNWRDIMACVSEDGAPMITDTSEHVPYGDEETSGLDWHLVPTGAISTKTIIRECGL